MSTHFTYQIRKERPDIFSAVKEFMTESFTTRLTTARKLALYYFLFGYFVGTAGGFGARYQFSEGVMWGFSIAFMPIVFTALSYLYFREIRHPRERYVDSELLQLIVIWLAASWALDGILYGLAIPLIEGLPFGWKAVIREYSPLPWLNFASVIVLAIAGRVAYTDEERILKYCTRMIRHLRGLERKGTSLRNKKTAQETIGNQDSIQEAAK